jgi:hypothetical protein
MSEQAELQRIAKLADTLYSNFDMDSRVEDPYQLLACIIRDLEPSYFFGPIYSRQSTKQLLEPALKKKVELLYEFVGASTLPGLLKAHVCGDAAGFLKNVCSASADELGALSSVFDVGAFMEEFWKADQKGEQL